MIRGDGERIESRNGGEKHPFARTTFLGSKKNIA